MDSILHRKRPPNKNASHSDRGNSFIGILLIYIHGLALKLHLKSKSRTENKFNAVWIVFF